MQPLVLAHRGASAYAGDNSIEAFEMAVAQGADGVELDVRFTADRVVVLHHDPDIGEMGPLIHHEFATVRCAHPEVPTLDEALEALADLVINIEIKNSPLEPDFDPTHEMADLIAHWVARNDLFERVLVTSFNPATMTAVRAFDPAVTTGQLVDRGFRFNRDLQPVVDAGHSWLAANVEDVMTDPIGSVRATHESGLRIGVWTVDDPDAIGALAAAGADALVCNDPAAALALLGRSAV